MCSFNKGQDPRLIPGVATMSVLRDDILTGSRLLSRVKVPQETGEKALPAVGSGGGCGSVRHANRMSANSAGAPPTCSGRPSRKSRGSPPTLALMYASPNALPSTVSHTLVMRPTAFPPAAFTQTCNSTPDITYFTGSPLCAGRLGRPNGERLLVCGACRAILGYISAKCPPITCHGLHQSRRHEHAGASNITDLVL
jgi:hypothetical protein